MEYTPLDEKYMPSIYNCLVRAQHIRLHMGGLLPHPMYPLFSVLCVLPQLLYLCWHFFLTVNTPLVTVNKMHEASFFPCLESPLLFFTAAFNFNSLKSKIILYNSKVVEVCLSLGYILVNSSWGHEKKVLFHKLIAGDGSTGSCSSTILLVAKNHHGFFRLSSALQFYLFEFCDFVAQCIYHVGPFVFLVNWLFYHLIFHPNPAKCFFCFTLWDIWYVHIDCWLHGSSSSIH